MERIFLLGPALLAFMAATVLSACGGGGGSGAPVGASAPPVAEAERYALVAAHNGDSLASYAVNADTGLMRLVDRLPVNQAASVALRPGHDQVVVLSSAGSVGHYQLGADGGL